MKKFKLQCPLKGQDLLGNIFNTSVQLLQKLRYFIKIFLRGGGGVGVTSVISVKMSDKVGIYSQLSAVPLVTAGKSFCDVSD